MSKALIPLGLIAAAGVMGSLASGQGNRGRRASDEDRVARMDAITESVGVRAQATLQAMKDEAHWHQRRARSIERAWSNWDWGELHFYGLINKADFAFVEEFLGDYTYDI